MPADPIKETQQESTLQPSAEAPVTLEFSAKYDRTHAEHYLHKHQAGLARRLSHWRDCQLARQALKIAGNPVTILDLPCGAGRFWPLLAASEDRILYAADNSPDMLQVAMKSQPAWITQRTTVLQTSAFAIDLPDHAVDAIFCMRLLHHIEDPAHRLAMLKEFYRVTRSTVILSLWVDGNYKAWKRKQLEARRASAGKLQSNRNRFVLNQKQAEAEFAEAGFAILGYRDFLPWYAMWRVYVLKKKEEQ